MEEKIKAALEAESKNGKIACKTALEMAKTLGCDPAEIGKAANEMKIKVVACSLGCF